MIFTRGQPVKPINWAEVVFTPLKPPKAPRVKVPSVRMPKAPKVSRRRAAALKPPRVPKAFTPRVKVGYKVKYRAGDEVKGHRLVEVLRKTADGQRVWASDCLKCSGRVEFIPTRPRSVGCWGCYGRRKQYRRFETVTHPEAGMGVVTYAVSGDMSAVIAEVLAGKGLRLSEVAKLFPGGRMRKDGSRSERSVTSVNRLVTHGTKARGGGVVRLEACRVGNTWYSTKEAVARFIAASTAGDMPGTGVAGDRQ